VTVCIAAICQGPFGPVVLAASDRMVTVEDIEFEPPMPKVWQLSHTIGMLIAGQSGPQAELFDRISHQQPKTVQEAIQLYCSELGNLNRRNAERDILAPLGLTMKSFLIRQREMAPEFVEQLRVEIDKNRANVQTIICGIDKRGAQLYTIDAYGKATCNNVVGFAAIGAGRWHAESQFMFAEYTPIWPLSKALLLLYVAKKRAEVAPGVGEATDYISIAADFVRIDPNDPIHRAVEIGRDRIIEIQDSAINEEFAKVDSFVNEFMAQARQQTASTQLPPTTPQQPKRKKPKT